MANVVDPNSWRMIPPSDPQRPLQSTPLGEPNGPGGASHEHAGAESTALGALTRALGQTFDPQRDQLVWNFASSAQQPQRFVRVDAEHGTSAAEHTGADIPWLVIVEDAREVVAGHHFDRLQAALAQGSPLLVVACEVDVPQAAQTDAAPDMAVRAVDVAARLRCQYVGPIVAGDARELGEALERIKRQRLPTLLHVSARSGGAPPPHFDAAAGSREPGSTDVGAPRFIAAQALAQLARDDERIVALATHVEDALADAWQAPAERLLPVDAELSGALAWCANLATSGSRPFVFLSTEEAQDHLGEIRRDICMPRAAVTLVVEARRGDAAGRKSSSLAGIRQLPHVALLAPKDGAELVQMLAWCAGHDAPALIWLGPGLDTDRERPPGARIALGRGEALRSGRDVAIVAWGPMSAAAVAAAERLAADGIEAAVVNARFAQPLDDETIGEAASGSTYVVLVDDAEQRGGFAGWVLEALLRAGVTQPIAVVSPPMPGDRSDPHDLRDRAARAIAERCRWLADPAATVGSAVGPDVPLITGDRAVSASWFAAAVLPASGAADLQKQVLSHQFSPFVEHWVREYSEVGARDVYLWRWCLHGLGLTTLSCVAPPLREDLCDTKLLAVMYGVMLDDVADQGGSYDFLNELTKIIAGSPGRDFSRFMPRQQRYAQFTSALWETFESRLKCSPHYAEYEELLEYDHRQILNTFAYSWLVNRRPALLNVQEHDMYLPHNMQMMSFATMDLMCSPGFDRNELGKLREVIWHAQSMGRIGNLVSTWQREIADRDFTSGVFARALRQGDLTLDELASGSPEAIEEAVRRGGHERYFLRKWEAHRQCIQALAPYVRSVDVGQLLEALTKLIRMELCSRGFK